MRRASLLLLLFGIALSPAAVAQNANTAAPVTIPFDLVVRHVIVRVTVNNSRPLSFILDSGANQAIIRTDIAKELGLKLEGQVTGRGAGPGVQTGAFVRNAKWSLVGLTGFSQPVTLALPFADLPSALGQPVDGIIGGEFIKEFVVELDYQAKQIRLHKPAAFTYTGPGESIPVEFVDVSHPTIPATVTTIGGSPIRGQFLFDIGAGQALALHSPFVREQKLLDGTRQTIRAIGGAGAGGKTSGQLGRVEALQIGSVALAQPITVFSEDDAGAFANAKLIGNIGAQVAMRFRVFLDYSRRRIIFEPTPAVRDPFDRAMSGLVLRAFGDDFRTFRVTEILEHSPATQAGIEVGDVITAIDDVPAAQLTLSAIQEMFDKPVRRSLTIRRGDRTLTVPLTPARLI